MGNDSDWSGRTCCRYHVAVAHGQRGRCHFSILVGILSRYDSGNVTESWHGCLARIYIARNQVDRRHHQYYYLSHNVSTSLF